MNIKQIRRDFPNLEQLIWLNNAGTSFIPTPTRIAIPEYLERQAYTYPFDFNFTEIWDRPVSQLLNADHRETICVQTTADGLNRIFHGLNLENTDNIVTCDLEYPGVVIPLFQLQQRLNFEIRMAKHANGQYPLDSILNLIDDNTRAVVISHVEWMGGWRHDLAQISKKAKVHNALLIVDPIQSLGAFEVDVKKMGIDALSAQGIKWLISPVGSGVMYIRHELIEEISHTSSGVGSLANQKKFWNLIQEEVSYMEAIKIWTIRTDMRKFYPSTSNHLGMIGLGRSVQYLLDLGVSNIEQRVLNLSEFVSQLLTDHGYQIFGPMDRAHRSGIICFNPQNSNLKEICERLIEQKIHIIARGGMLRISPHFYNTEEEITRCIEAIVQLDRA